jgi:hypothetical protein
MGWTFTDYRQPGMSHAEFFSKELLRSPEEGGTSRIIDSAYVPAEEGSVFYAAVATESSAGSEVWALIVLTQGRSGARFGWKEMDETMGPAEDGCPARILDLLSETDNEHALEWRGRCRERVALLESAVEGAVLEFSADYLSPTGAYKQFVAIDPSKDSFRAPDGNAYRLVGWRRSEFRVLERAS